MEVFSRALGGWMQGGREGGREGGEGGKCWLEFYRHFLGFPLASIPVSTSRQLFKISCSLCSTSKAKRETIANTLGSGGQGLW